MNRLATGDQFLFGMGERISLLPRPFNGDADVTHPHEVFS